MQTFIKLVNVIKNGSIIKEGTPHEVFDDIDLIRDADLRLPRVAHLLEVLENLGLLKSLRKVSIDELIEYRKKYSMNIMYKIQKKGNSLSINFCLELPGKLLKSEDSALHKIVIYLNPNRRSP